MTDIDALEHNEIQAQYNLPKNAQIVAAAGEYTLYKTNDNALPFHWVHADGTYRSGHKTEDGALSFSVRL